LRESRGTLWSKAVILAFLVAPLVWAILYFVFKLPPGTLLQSLLGGQGPGGVQAPLQQKPGVWLWVVQAVLVYPVLEEIVFRGALQGWLLQRFKRTGSSAEANPGQLRHRLLHLVSLPNLLTTIAFTALHFIHQPPLWAALVFFPSLVFGWAREYSGALWLPILLHVWYNAGFYLLFVQL